MKSTNARQAPASHLRAAVSIAAFVMLFGFSGAGVAQAPAKVRILYAPAFTGHLPVLIAQDAGFLGRNGISAELIGAAEPIKPMISGDADIALPAPAVVAVAAVQGVNVKIILSVQRRITQSLLVQPELARELKSKPGNYPAVVKELAGKKIGVSTRGGAVDINLRYLLIAAGLTPDKDVFVVPLGGGGPMVAGMKGKQVDGILGFPPLSNQLIADGGAVSIVDLAKGEGPKALDQPFVVAAVLTRYLDQNEATVRRFVTAMTQTMDFIKDPKNKAELTKISTTRLAGMSPAVIDGVVAELATTVDPKFTAEDLVRVNEVQRALGVLSRDVRPEEVMSDKFQTNK
jgi:NitT/TauT family transport system substrate-binding protein